MAEEDFTPNLLKLIIRTRLDMEQEFQEGKKKKSVLWGKIMQQIKDKKPDVNMTKEQISRKFLNLMTTYKRIKQRNNLSGRNASSWEFYDDFDEVYGTKHSINPPLQNMQSSLNVDTSQTAALDSHDNAFPADESTDVPNAKRQKLSTNDTINFLQEEAKKEQERHVEIVELERQKIAIERERVQALLGLKDILEKALNK